MSLAFDQIAVIGWLLIAAAWILFRRPGVALFSTVRVWRPQDYVRPMGVVLWIVGGAMFLVGIASVFFTRAN